MVLRLDFLVVALALVPLSNFGMFFFCFWRLPEPQSFLMWGFLLSHSSSPVKSKPRSKLFCLSMYFLMFFSLSPTVALILKKPHTKRQCCVGEI
jgi:hypothetical protein